MFFGLIIKQIHAMDITPIVAAIANQITIERITENYIDLLGGIYSNAYLDKPNVNGNIVENSKLKAHEKIINGLLDDEKRHLIITGLISDREIKPQIKDELNCLQYIDNEEYERAICILEYNINSQPESWELITQVMLLYARLGKIGKAINAFYRAIQISPNQIGLRINGAILLYKNGEISSALDHYEFILQDHPDHYPTLLLTGEMLSQTPSLQKAEIMLNNYLVYAPKDNPQSGHLQAAVNLLIISYLNFDLEKCYEMIYIIRVMVGKGYTKSISVEANRTFVRAFSRLIKKHLELLEEHSELKKDVLNDNGIKTNDNQQIIHIGDSHCFAFAHQTIRYNGSISRIHPRIIKGAKAWHFCQEYNNSYKTAFKLHVDDFPEKSLVWISFGEIDCRMNEGILHYCKKYNQDIEFVSAYTAKGYFYWIHKMLSSSKHRQCYFGVPAPSKDYVKRFEPRDEDLRLKIIHSFNSSLEDCCKKVNIRYLDIYSFTARPDGFNNRLYMIDEYHLSPLALHKLAFK